MSQLKPVVTADGAHYGNCALESPASALQISSQCVVIMGSFIHVSVPLRLNIASRRFPRMQTVFSRSSKFQSRQEVRYLLLLTRKGWRGYRQPFAVTSSSVWLS